MSKMSKKVVSVLASAAISVSAISGTVFASVSTDVIGTKYEESAKVLGALDIMVGDAGTGLFRPDDIIKRSEVTKVAVALKGLSDTAASSSYATKYPDVVSDHWANGYINVGTNQGMIIGDDLGNFRPDDRITYAEAVTMIVRALGYEPQALSKGGFPTGYVSTGTSIGLTKGVTSSVNGYISRGDVAELAYNSLTIKMMEQVNYGNDKYEVVDKTLLSDCLDTKLVKGQVTAVGDATIDGKSAGKGMITIDGENYKCADADVRSVLGFNVEAYVYNGSNSRKNSLLVAVPTASANKTLTIAADDIDSVTGSSSKVISYTNQSNKTSKETIPADATVIYNGKLSDMNDVKQIDSGSVILLDSDKSGKYNIVFVNETVNYVVDEIASASHRIIDKYNQGSLTIDPDDDDITYVIDKDNKSVEADELEEWDVITTTVSRDGSLIYGYVTRNAVEGKISSTNKDGVTINGKRYKIASNYTDSLKNNDAGTFYLDAEGKIAAYDNNKSSGRNYAYLADMAEKGGLSDTVRLKMFTSEGKTVTLETANKIKVNDVSGLSSTAAMKAIGDKGQLVSYELDSNGAVYTVNTFANGEIDEDKYVHNLNEKNVEYKSASSKLVASDVNVGVSADTVIFEIPDGSTKSDDWSVRSKSFFVDGGKYDISVFDMKENLNAGVIIVTSSDSKAGEDTSAAVVDSVSKTTNSDGEDAEILTAFVDGKEVNITSTKTGVFAKGGKALETGDIVQVKTNSAGLAESVTVLFDTDNKTEQRVDHSANLTTVYGTVAKKFSNSFNLQVNGGSASNYTIGDAPIYVVEKSRNSSIVKTGSAKDIQKYDSSKPEKVFVRVYKDTVKEIVIFR